MLTSLAPSSHGEFSMSILNVKRAPEMSTIFGSQLLRQESNDFQIATQNFEPPV